MPRREASKPRKAAVPDTQGKRVQFDLETWQALDVLARGRMMTFQELADEAFRDLLMKHGRPMDVRDAFRKSARAVGEGSKTAKPKKRKPAGLLRVR